MTPSVLKTIEAYQLLIEALYREIDAFQSKALRKPLSIDDEAVVELCFLEIDETLQKIAAMMSRTLVQA